MVVAAIYACGELPAAICAHGELPVAICACGELPVTIKGMHVQCTTKFGMLLYKDCLSALASFHIAREQG